jgi:hypothetical protein
MPDPDAAPHHCSQGETRSFRLWAHRLAHRPLRDSPALRGPGVSPRTPERDAIALAREVIYAAAEG